MMVNDNWVRAAMTDDTVVVELLLRLKHSLPFKSHSLPLTWGLKQPRSTSRSRLSAAAAASRCDGAVSTRCSPTTPLSWSGGASPSATADGYEESSRRHAARSKATATSGYTGNSASTKRCRRKKTFAELKEEESSLIKERIHLQKEIANAKANFEAARAKNEKIKRLKLDLDTKSRVNPSSTSVEMQCKPAGQPHQRIVALGAIKVKHATQDDTHLQASESRPTGEGFSVIPDLNMMPPDVASYTDDLCGMR